MLTKRRSLAAAAATSGSGGRALPVAADNGGGEGSGGGSTVNRRRFLQASGLTAGGLAALAGGLNLTTVRAAKAASEAPGGPPVEVRKNICTHCSVGCTVTAEVQNGVWVGQEPSLYSPINLDRKSVV